MVGDDKRCGAGFGGMVFTRIVCANTWRAAISEGGVFKISHVQDPLALWKFATAQINAAVKAYKEQGATLDKFFNTSIGRRQFQEFLEETVQQPNVPKAVARSLEAKDQTTNESLSLSNDVEKQCLGDTTFTMHSTPIHLKPSTPPSKD
jgi:hypothetical protein